MTQQNAQAGVGSAAAAPPLWTVAALRHQIGNRTILGPVDLTLAAGRVYGLIGPNGSGKSTLLKVLARQLAPSAGTVLFDGEPVKAFAERAFARNVAYMPQLTPPADGMSVGDLVALGRFPWHGTLGRFSPTDQAKVDEAIVRTGLGTFQHRAVDSLSGGERQRAWLALMLAQDTRCLLLDEPTSALDIAHQTEMLELVRSLAHGGATNASPGGHQALSVVVVLHDVNLAVRTCDELIALRGGQVIAQGPPAAVMQPATLEALYGVPMGVMPHPVRGEPLGYVL